MRVLVAGSLPPPDNERAAALFGLAADLAEAGETVELLSPQRRWAWQSGGQLGGVAGCLNLYRTRSRFDRLVLQVEPGVPLRRRATRLERALIMVLLGRVLSSYSEVTLCLHDLDDLPQGVGGRAMRPLWTAVDSVVVAREADRAVVLQASGLPEDRVVVTGKAAAEGKEEDREWPRPAGGGSTGSLGEEGRGSAGAGRRRGPGILPEAGWEVPEGEDDRLFVSELIRARAARERALAGGVASELELLSLIQASLGHGPGRERVARLCRRGMRAIGDRL